MLPLESSHQIARQAIRACIRSRRQSLSVDQQYQFSHQVTERLLSYRPVIAAKHIAVFLSFDGEIETTPLINSLWQQDKSVYLPTLHPFSPGNLLFLHHTPDTPLVTNRLRILEPVLDVRNVLPLAQLDILITPLVAFDNQGQRLGMGGGFYDRTLQNWQQLGCYPIGIAHDCQEVESLPTEAWDIPLPAIVTPSRILEW